MNKALLTIILFCVFHISVAQKPIEKYPFRKLTTEPAVGARLASLLGSSDIQLSNLIQYNLYTKLSLTAHTAISSNFKNSRIVDVDQNYNYSISQKIGIGTSFNTKRASNAFFILGGLKYQASSSTLNNEEIPEHITSKTSSITPDYGVMYNLKLGRKKYFFSSRVYVPINDGLYGIMENANLECGIGIGLK